MGLRLGLSILAFVGALMSAAPGSATCGRPLAFGWNDWPPYQVATGNTPAGIDPAIVSILADATGCTIRWVRAPWKRQLDLLAKGAIDAVLTANYTRARARYGTFSKPYLTYEAILWRASTAERRDVPSLRAYLETGRRVGITRGYTYGAHADALLALPRYHGQVVINETVESNVLMLANDRIDGLLGNRHTVAYLARQNGVADAIHATGLVVQRAPVHILWSDAAVPESVVRIWDRAITRQRATGAFERIRVQHTARGPTGVRHGAGTD